MEGPRLQVQEELLLAKQSRLEGNEGRARVCARRAAGAAVQAYLSMDGSLPVGESVIQSLIRFKRTGQIPPRVRIAVNWLVKRVNQDYSFPADVDLIHEAGVVIQYIEGEKSSRS